MNIEQWKEKVEKTIVMRAEEARRTEEKAKEKFLACFDKDSVGAIKWYSAQVVYAITYREWCEMLAMRRENMKDVPLIEFLTKTLSRWTQDLILRSDDGRSTSLYSNANDHWARKATANAVRDIMEWVEGYELMDKGENE